MQESKEAVAFALLEIIGRHEGKRYDKEMRADREWVLRTYAQCLKVTSGLSNIESILALSDPLPKGQ
ncbi:MAG: hypothetical protein FD153_1343 [Rhodospirillaceae bacterium]|nr:MAG: hypothetical protein FD153_1343 [Rhodospirillaceae bacterium]